MSCHVTVKQGNLLDETDADFIVNPSNTLLTLGSGVSAAFARACGSELQTLMYRKRAETGRLEKGDVVATGPGRCRRFRTVLHAAVMDYNPGAQETAPRLDDIRTVLRRIDAVLSDAAAVSPRVKLVLPLMGTGVGGLDKKEVALLYREFFRRPRPYECEAVVYGHTPDDAALLSATILSRGSGESFRSAPSPG